MTSWTEDEGGSDPPAGHGEPGTSVGSLLRELARVPELSLRGTWDGALRPGAVFGRFELVREIGRGGFGRVWEARDRELGRPVAFKAVRLADRGALRDERLLQEADVAARLAHPNIVTLHDAGRCENGPYVVFELLLGRTLAARLADGPVPTAEAMEIALALARGLAHAHERGVVHRDLKPGNVFLTRDGQVKILDFGLAHAFGARKVDGGTPPFMAPEQRCGAPEDERTDVFALGVIVFRLFGHRLPFPEGEATAAGGAAPIPELRVPEAPHLGELVSRMLETDPVRRPRDGGEVLAALVAVASGAAPPPIAARAAERSPAVSPPATPPAPMAAGPGVEGEAHLLPPRRGRARRAAYALAVLAALAALAAVPLVRERVADVIRPLPAEKTLAVLPFRGTGGSGAEEAFAAGLAEIMTNKLQQWEALRPALRVVSPAEVRREAISSPRQAREALGATLGLEGSVHWEGDRVAVAVNLVDTRSLLVLEARDVEAPRAEAQAVLAALLDRVADMLRVELEPAGKRAPLEPVRAPGAWEFYLQGRGYLQRYDRVENLDSALAVLDQALARDAGYALAHAGKAEAHLRRYEATRDRRSLALARDSARRAVELGGDVAAVQLTMGLVEAAAADHGAAIRSFRRALELEPGNADVHRELARAYDGAGRPAEAEATHRRAIELRPDSWSAYKDLGAFYNRHGRLEEALPLFQRVVELTPDNYAGYANLGGVLLRLGRRAEATRALERSLALRPTARAYSNLGSVHFYDRRYREAAELYRKAVELGGADARLWGSLGDAERWAGRADEARRAYRQALALAAKDLELRPRDAELRSRMAIHESALGDRARAMAHVEEARRLAPEDGLVLFRSALVYEEAGRREQALAAVRGAIAAGYSTVEIAGAPPLEALRRDPRYAVSAPRVPQGSNPQ
ncbi:MAG TPA: protein kinase [Anaeromyxobacter sp.]|nr:protein kinase [Anaeromyxobacter sp.]